MVAARSAAPTQIVRRRDATRCIREVMNPDVRFGSRADEWPRERIAHLERDEIEHLRANARELGESEIAELCDAVLATRGERGRGATATRAKAKRLVSRSAAFEARGVYLHNLRT